MVSFELEMIIISLLILLNALLSFSEMSIITSDRLKIKKMVDDGNHRAKSLISLLNQPSRFLSSIQIGITLIGILAGAFGGATIAEELEGYFSNLRMFGEYSEYISIAIVVITTTFFSILFGELIPKRIALSDPERFAMLVARPISFIIKLFLPLVSMFSWLTDKILLVLLMGSEDKKVISKDYLKNIVEQGTEEGSLKNIEQEFIYNFLILDKIKVDSIMTRRGEVVYFDINGSVSDHKRISLEHSCDYFPLCDQSLDNVIGVIESKEFLKSFLRQDLYDLRSLAKAPLFIPDKISALQLLESFRKFHMTIALVVDEFGGVEGIVSLSDILNRFFIELQAIRTKKSEIIKYDHNAYYADGSLPLNKIKDLLNVKRLPDEGRYSTIAGFLLDRLQKIPNVNDNLIYGGYKFEIMAMNGNRIDKVRIIKN